jgi:hypothetical protein
VSFGAGENEMVRALHRIPAFLLPAAFATLSLPARAAAYKPYEPQVSLGGAKVTLCIGAFFTLAALATFLVNTTIRRRFSFSLRWLLAFSISCGVMIGGAARMKLAERQLSQYNSEVEMRTALDRKVSFCIGSRSVNEMMSFLGQLSNLKISIDPRIAATNKPLITMRCEDIKLENAYKALAASAGLECTFSPGIVNLAVLLQCPVHSNQ